MEHWRIYSRSVAGVFFALLALLTIPSVPSALDVGTDRQPVLHFDPSVSNDLAQNIRAFVPQLGEALGPFFSCGIRTSAPIRAPAIRIFATEKSYRDYQKVNSKSRGRRSYYSIRDQELVILISSQSEDWRADLLHEASHHYWRHAFGKHQFDRCLDEGFAEVFEAAEFKKDFVRVGSRSMRWLQVLRKELGPAYSTPGYALSMSPEDFLAGGEGAVAFCWAVAQYLWEKNGPQRSCEIVQSLLQEGGIRDLPEASAWKEWVESLSKP